MNQDENPLERAERMIAEGRAFEAAVLLAARLAEGKGGLSMRLLLVRAFLAAGDNQGAIVVARETALLHPDVAAAALGLGEALLATERLPTAIAEFQRALRLDPDMNEARFSLGLAWLKAGEAQMALQAFAEAAPDTPGLAAKIAEAQAMLARPRSDAGYVRHLFDQFSADYDARMLSQLHYRAPPILRELFGMIAPGQDRLAVLDLGCGTGLSGAAFKGLTARLDGVDLSPRMIEKARARGIYDVLFVADIENPPVEDGGYDLALAADTLVYLGDLETLFAAVRRALKPGGFFLFTVEQKDGEGFELGLKRRWRHSQSYLRAQAAAGFEIAGLLECVPRREKGENVAGYAVALCKTA